MMIKKKDIKGIGVAVGILILMLLEFVLHRKIPFMMDDLWYSTNLATGEKLQGFFDIVESQVWHFFNWGGRNITHGILQAVLMTGELAADLLNVVMTLLLAWMICVIAGQKKPVWFLCVSVMLVGLNANLKMSMYWQSGTVNYVYATVWILLFLWAYLRQIQTPDAKPVPLIHLWIIPIGLMTGWSNENMGPASFVIAVAVMVYLKKVFHKKIPVWMISGSVFCLLGSIMMILAPGNFVRTAEIPKVGFWEKIYDRILSMLCAGTDFLFPTAVLLAAVLLIYLICLKEKLHPAQWMLLAHGILSYGAMVLSPHYPDRATFGTMSVCIILMISVVADMLHKRKTWSRYFAIAMTSMWIYAVYVIVNEIYFVGVPV